MLKITVIFTGGTIGSSRDGDVISPRAENSRLLLDMYRRSGGEAELTVKEPYRILSENLTADRLLSLGDCVKNSLDGCDGVIVTHGTDTLPYASAYLGYMFGGSSVPIVLVSANYPLADSRSNGLQNFRAAADFIRCAGGTGVFVSYKNTGDGFTTIHRATRLLPQLPYTDSVFSATGACYGRTEGKGFCKNTSYSAVKDEVSFGGEIYGDVLFLRAHPCMTLPQLTPQIRAVLLEGYHSGTLPTDVPGFCDFCDEARKKAVPVYLTGACEGFDYESKQSFSRLGIVPLPAASPAAMYVKLLLCKNPADVLKPCAEDFVLMP